MKRFDLTFAVKDCTQDAIRALVSEKLSLNFETRSSEYLGGLYFYATRGHEEIRIQPNRDADSEPAEEAYADCSVLVLVDSTSDPDLWKMALSSLGAVIIREIVY